MTATWTHAPHSPELEPYVFALALALTLARYLPHLLALYACTTLPPGRVRLYGHTVQATTPRPVPRVPRVRRDCRCRCHDTR